MGEQADLIIDNMLGFGFGGSYRSRERQTGAVITTEDIRAMTTRHLKALLSKDITQGSYKRIKKELRVRAQRTERGLKKLRELRHD